MGMRFGTALHIHLTECCSGKAAFPSQTKRSCVSPQLEVVGQALQCGARVARDERIRGGAAKPAQRARTEASRLSSPFNLSCSSPVQPGVKKRQLQLLCHAVSRVAAKSEQGWLSAARTRSAAGPPRAAGRRPRGAMRRPWTGWPARRAGHDVPCTRGRHGQGTA